MARKKEKEQKKIKVEEPLAEQAAVETQETSKKTEPLQEEIGKEPVENQKLEVLQKENDGLKDKYLRLRAEFDNYRKRTLKEKLEDRKLAKKDIVTDLLPVLDDFDRAKQVAEANEAEAFSEGIKLVYQKLQNKLAQHGLEAIDSNGATFDPDIHEAFTEISAPAKEMKGKVIDTIEKGYKLNGIIIRHPKVVVGK